MSNEPILPINPHNLTAADIAAMEAANPEAYGKEPAEAAPVAAAPVAAAPVAEPAAPAAPAAVPGEAAPIMIPKSRFDEVNNESKGKDVAISERDRIIAEQAARLAELDRKPEAVTRDFDAEHAALAERYDNAEIDRAEFNALQRALQKEEIAVTAAQVATSVIAERDKQTVEQQFNAAWESAGTSFKDANKDFMAIDGAAGALDSALELLDKQTGYKLSPAELYAKAAPVAAAMLGVPAPGGTAAAPVPANPHAVRNAADAAAQAQASGAPPAFQGGAGDRGHATTIDLTMVKPGDFGKLAKVDQDRAMGLLDV